MTPKERDWLSHPVFRVIGRLGYLGVWGMGAVLLFALLQDRHDPTPRLVALVGQVSAGAWFFAWAVIIVVYGVQWLWEWVERLKR